MKHIRSLSYVLIALLLLLLAACSGGGSIPDPEIVWDCDNVKAKIAALQPLIGMNKEEMRLLLAQKPDTAPMTEVYDNRSSRVWNEDGDHIRAIIEPDIYERYAGIHVEWETHTTDLKTIFACFGAPTSYRAFTWQDIEARGYFLELWYPELGVVWQRQGFSTRRVLTRSQTASPTYISRTGTRLPKWPPLFLTEAVASIKVNS